MQKAGFSHDEAHFIYDFVQAKQSDERDRQRFGDNLLHLDLKTEEDQKIERQVKQMMKKQRSPRKGHEPISEEVR